MEGAEKGHGLRINPMPLTQQLIHGLRQGGGTAPLTGG